MANKSGASPEAVALPVGGGGVRGLGENFQPDLSTGVGVYNIPLEFPKGPNGLTPNLGVTYSTGSGNGPWGVGWNLNLPSISRRAERGMPAFDDEGDTFQVVGEELVAIGDGEYRLRVDKEFTRFFRRPTHWEAIKRDGHRLIFGQSPDHRVESTEGGRTLTQRWHLERLSDSNGNTLRFSYLSDGNCLYLRTVEYAIYRIELEYQPRPDPFSSFRSGFEIRTALRCSRLTLRILPLGADPVRAWRFEYVETPLSRLSMLARVTASGLDAQTGASGELPVLEFGYTGVEPGRPRYRPFTSLVGAPPPGIGGPNLDLLDLEGHGLPGVVEVDNGMPRYWPNRGRSRWGPPRALRHLPAALSLGEDQVRFADMDGNGAADLLVGSGPLSGYYENNGQGDWQGFRHYARSPGLGFDERGLQLLDVDGDGVIDAVQGARTGLYVYRNRGPAGWDQPRLVPAAEQSGTFPGLPGDDPRIRLADMTGDGFLDVVRIVSGHLEYWPSRGNGRFAEGRVMAAAPRFPYPFDPRRVFLTDVNGDGLADVVFVGYDAVTYWINQSGNGFSLPQVVRGTPPTGETETLRLADMNGTGTAGLLWTAPFRDYRFLDFTGPVKPGLLARIDNHLGMVTTISYTTSTEEAVRDREAGRPWTTFLPFPVQLVSEITVRDEPADTTNRVQIAYHDGHFDPRTRQFTGFGKVEQAELGDESEPTTLTVSYFHNRVPAGTGDDQAPAARALRRMLYRTEVYGLDGTPLEGRPYTVEEVTWEAREVATGPSGDTVFFPAKAVATHTVRERGDQATVVTTRYDYDDAGNVAREVRTGDWHDADMQPGQVRLVNETTYATSPDIGTTRWPASQRTLDQAGQLLCETRYYYDGPPAVGLPRGQATLGNLVRVEEVCLDERLRDDLYGSDVPDLLALGYRAEAHPTLGTLFVRDRQRLEVDARGNPVRKIDVNGEVTMVEFDADGIYPMRIVDPRGFASLFTFHLPTGNVESYTDINGNQGHYRFDALGRVVALRQPGDAPDRPSLEYEYHTESIPQVAVLRTRQEQGSAEQVTSCEYFDGHARPLQRRSQAEQGQVAVAAQPIYNAKNHPRGERAAFFSTSLAFDPAETGQPPASARIRRDALGREVEVVDPTGGRFVTRYQPNRIAYFDAVHAPALDNDPDTPAPRQEYFDGFGRLSAVWERTGAETRTSRYEYDAMGALLRGVDPLGNELFATTYDLVERKLRVRHRESGTQVRVYNARNCLVEQRTAGVGTVHRDYDADGRVIETRFGGPAASLEERYLYDSGPGENLKGRVARVEGRFGIVDYSYHASGRVKSITRTFAGLPGSFTMQFDANSADRVTRVVYPDGSPIQLRYGEGGLLAGIDGVITQIRYGPTGKRELVRYANGLETTWRYEPGLYWLRELRTVEPVSGVSYQQLVYERDAVGNVTAIDDQATLTGKVRNTRRFRYDDLYQLVSAQGRDASGTYLHEYGYDELGTLRSNPDAFAADFAYGDPAHPTRLTGLAGGPPDEYRHDEDGNLTHTPDLDLQYDPWSRLVRVTKTDGTVVDFVYDHDGHRTAVHVTKAGVTASEYNFNDLYLIRGTETVKVVWDDIQKTALIDASGQGKILHADHLGNTNLVTDLADGRFLGQEEYYPFGGTVVSITMPTGFRFNSKPLDTETGLYFFGARYYSTTLGRFLTPDPYLRYSPHLGLRKPGSIHLTAFVMNNPVNIVDRQGLWFGWDDLIVAGIGFVGGVIGALINGADTWDEVLLSGLAGAAGAWLLWNLAPLAIGAMGWSLGGLGASPLGGRIHGRRNLRGPLRRRPDRRHRHHPGPRFPRQPGGRLLQLRHQVRHVAHHHRRRADCRVHPDRLRPLGKRGLVQPRGHRLPDRREQPAFRGRHDLGRDRPVARRRPQRSSGPARDVPLPAVRLRRGRVRADLGDRRRPVGPGRIVDRHGKPRLRLLDGRFARRRPDRQPAGEPGAQHKLESHLLAPPRVRAIADPSYHGPPSPNSAAPAGTSTPASSRTSGYPASRVPCTLSHIGEQAAVERRSLVRRAERVWARRRGVRSARLANGGTIDATGCAEFRHQDGAGRCRL